VGVQRSNVLIHGKFRCRVPGSDVDMIASKPWLRPRALAFPKPKPGQKPTQAKVMARPGPAFFGLAWPGFWLQAGAGTSLIWRSEQRN
jgi:hypothetical protein